MPEYIIDRQTGDITYVAGNPIPFSISGKYVVNVPDFLQIVPGSNSVSDLITQKIDGFKSAHSTLVNSVSDEFITSPNVDNAQSTKFMVGNGKRTSIFPGGSIVTNLINIAAPSSTLFSYWSGYSLTSVPDVSAIPGPDKVLHNYDEGSSQFVPFDPATFAVDLRNSGNTSTIATMVFNQEQSVPLAAGNYRLRFTNSSPDTVYFLSDWLLLYN